MSAPANRPIGGSDIAASEFTQLRDLLYRESGIVLPESKISLMVSRLNKRLRHLQLPDFGAYFRYIEADQSGEELREMVAAMTTNVTSFFRESHHFTQAAQTILPPLLERVKAGKSRLRIWSAGCSTGEEPYSIAITLLELCPEAARYDIKILATDIDPHALSRARTGNYPAGLTKGLSDARAHKFFDPIEINGNSAWRARAELRNLITFEALNLHQNWPMRGPFDLIFCRNVVIYFDETTRSQLWQRFAHILTPEGWLFTGHSERLDAAAMRHFALDGITAYRRHGAHNQACPIAADATPRAMPRAMSRATCTPDAPQSSTNHITRGYAP